MFLSESEKQSIIDAIALAEKQTSGEIKVHIEKICPYSDPKKRAEELFNYLELDKTENRNGVLIYLAFQNKFYSIIGDKGINDKVNDNFWNSTGDILQEHLSWGDSVKGICLAVKEAGGQLKTHFPYQLNDKNEISDEISFG